MKTWNDVPIGIYQKFKNNSSDGLDTLCLFSGLSRKELDDFTPRQMNKLIDAISFIGEEPKSDFIKEWQDYTIFDFKKKGTASSMIDFMSVLDMGNFIENLHIILGIVCINGKEENFEEKTKRFQEEMPITIAFGLAGFFLTNFQISNKTLPYFIQMVKKGKVNPKNLAAMISKLNGNGLSGSID